jgi:hypothetical protein
MEVPMSTSSRVLYGERVRQILVTVPLRLADAPDVLKAVRRAVRDEGYGDWMLVAVHLNGCDEGSFFYNVVVSWV